MDRIASLMNFLKNSPEDNFLQHALALEQIKQGNDIAARLLFETILNRDESYIGSYYHLAKLLERTGDTDEAIKVYEKGMVNAKKTGDNHTYNELQAAYEDLTMAG
jgi:Tfp pilus assembly protein PilF